MASSLRLRTPPPPPPPARAAKPLDLEITVVSAKHLKNVNWRHGELKPYAVAYLDPGRRAATKPDDSGGARPVWNERLTLPLPFPFSSDDPSLLLTVDVFHSKPSETPKPLVGSARSPLKDLIDPDSFLSFSAAPAPIKTLELLRPSGRPQGKVRIKLAIRERPAPYQMPPPPPSPEYYYSPPPPPPTVLPYSFPYRGYSDPYSSYYPSPAPYYSAHPASAPAPAPAPFPTSTYYDRTSGYRGPSAPVDYSPSPLSYDQREKGVRLGAGTGLAVSGFAGEFSGLTLHEGIKYEQQKTGDRVEINGIDTRESYSDYRGD